MSFLSLGWITRLLCIRAGRERRAAKAHNRKAKRILLWGGFEDERLCRWSCREIIATWQKSKADVAAKLGHRDFQVRCVQVFFDECGFSFNPEFHDLRTESGRIKHEAVGTLFRELEPYSLCSAALLRREMRGARMGNVFDVLEDLAYLIKSYGIKVNSATGRRHLLAAALEAANGGPEFEHYIQCEKCESEVELVPDEKLVESFLKRRAEGLGDELICQQCGGLTCKK